MPVSKLEELMLQAVKRIWLIPVGADEGGLAFNWCGDPAPSPGMDPAESVEYVRADVHRRALRAAYDDRAAWQRLANNRAEQRDAQVAAEAMEQVALLVAKKADDYDAEHGTTDPSTGTREYPGDGAEHYNEMMELAEEIRSLIAKGRQTEESSE